MFSVLDCSWVASKSDVGIFVLMTSRPLWRLLVLLLTVVTLSSPILAFEQGKDAREFVQAVVANELKADANDHSRWMYRDDNKVPDEHTVKLVIQTADGDLSKTIEKNGHPLTSQEQSDDERKINDFVNDASVREKQKRDHEQDAKEQAR